MILNYVPLTVQQILHVNMIGNESMENLYISVRVLRVKFSNAMSFTYLVNNHDYDMTVFYIPLGTTRDNFEGDHQVFY